MKNKNDFINSPKVTSHTSPLVPKSELQLQAECFQWAWNQYPETRRLLFAVPNGGKRNIREAMSLKASGVVAGVPDLLFVWKGEIHAFELKTATGKLSCDQKDVFNKWDNHNIPIHIVRDFETFQSIIKQIITL